MIRKTDPTGLHGRQVECPGEVTAIAIFIPPRWFRRNPHRIGTFCSGCSRRLPAADHPLSVITWNEQQQAA